MGGPPHKPLPQTHPERLTARPEVQGLSVNVSP